MSCYFVASIRIRNKKEYLEYVRLARETFKKYKCRALSRDENPKVLEGKWDYSKLVLIEFESKSELLKWYESDEYKMIKKLRHRSADSWAIAAEGC